LVKYLCLDPSSRHVGWACMAAGGAILGAGKVSRTKGPYIDRVDELAVEVERLLKETGSTGGAIEIPSGGVHARHGGRGEGLSIYGFGAGVLYGVLKTGCKDGVEPILVSEWKSGYSKDKARKVAKKHYPPYADMKDPGADIADAVSLAVWFYEFRLRGKKTMPTKWWVTRAGDYLAVPDGDNFLDLVERHPAFFGVEGHEVTFAKQKGEDGQLALFDKICVDIESDGEVKIPGAIFIEQTGEGLTICLWRESYPAYERLMQWLASKKFNGNTQIIMREIGTSRGWQTNVRTLLTNPYAKNPNRRGNCPRCSHQISWDEIVERGVCPKCGEKLT